MKAARPATPTLLAGKTRSEVWAGPIVDADVHANVPGLEALEAYLDPVWRQFAEERGWRGPAAAFSTYPASLPTAARPEWRRDDGRMPASSIDMLRRELLDPWQVDFAILTCNYGIDSLRHPDWAAGVAHAVNDWVLKEWLEPEPRVRASIALPGRNVDAMVREIERVGDHPGFVAVTLPVRAERLYGDPRWFPVYKAMTARDLVLNLHWGGTGDGAPGPSGWPSWYVEEYAAEIGAFASQVVSLVGGGVFRKFPDLRVTVAEIGFTWLPAWMWRFDKDWKSLRREVPWLVEAPSATMRKHFRFTTAPTDAGPPAELAQFVQWLGSEELLLFATDYPHFHDDDLPTLLDPIPEPMREKTMAANARTWYRL